VIAFTRDGIEYLKQIIADKRAAGNGSPELNSPNSSACGAHRMLTDLVIWW